MKRIMFLVFFGISAAAVSGYGATLALKDGNKVSGKILERTADYVKILVSGMPLTYYFDQIRGIETAEEEPQPAGETAVSPGKADTADILFKQALNSIFEGDIRSAKEQLELGLKEDPFHKGLYEFAPVIKEWNKGVIGDKAAGYLLKGMVKFDGRQYMLAIEELERAVDEAPNCLTAHYKLGLAYLKTGSPDKALEHFKKTIDIDSEFNLGYRGIGIVYYELGEYKLAIRNLNKALETDYSDFSANLTLGSVYTAMNKFHLAKIYFERAVQVNPDDGRGYLELGRTYASLGFFAKARKKFIKAKELFLAQNDSEGIKQAENALSQLPFN